MATQQRGLSICPLPDNSAKNLFRSSETVSPSHPLTTKQWPGSPGCPLLNDTSPRRRQKSDPRVGLVCASQVAWISVTQAWSMSSLRRSGQCVVDEGFLVLGQVMLILEDPLADETV